MNREPSYLAHLGEFATLKNAIGSWYHQDAYLDFGTDEEIWSDMSTGHDKEAMSRIQAQLSELLGRSDEKIIGFWNSEAHSHVFINGTEARAFLEAMLSFFRAINQTA